MQTSLSGVDYFILGVIALSGLAGLWRGFLREAISLGAWFTAFIIAFVFVDEGAAYLGHHIDIPAVCIVLSFTTLFICTLIVGGLINLIVAQLVERTGLGGLDRLLGLLFGLLRGLALITLLVLMAGLTPLPQDPAWTQSPLLPHFQEAARWLGGFLPPNLEKEFKFP